MLATACGSDGESGAATTGAGTSTGEPATVTSSEAATTASPGSSGGSGSESSSETGAPPGCAASPQALADCIDLAAYTADLEFIADLRVPGTAHWQAVQDLGADRLDELGFDVQLFDYATGTNVIGTLQGASADAAHVIIGAHYDHIEDCAGADDNATGVAASLELARVLAMGSYDLSITIALWDEEEQGLIGSEAFVQAAQSDGIAVAAYYNFEMIGYASSEPDTQQIPAGFDLVFPEQIAAIEANDNRGDFLFLAGDSDSTDAQVGIVVGANRVDLPVISVVLTPAQKTNDLFNDLRRSDHAPFWDAGFPAIFISDSGEFRNSRYHCFAGEDTVDTLVPSFTDKVMRATVESAAQVAGLQL